jgi:protein-S-isoprenylcysteine O-methyltransferase Ste14
MKEEAYNEMDQLISQALNEEPEFSLSTDFADRVSRKVGDRMLRKRLLSEYAWKVGVIVVPLLILAGIFFYFDPKTISHLFSNPANEYFPYILLIVLVGLIVFADQVILRFFLLRRK